MILSNAAQVRLHIFPC